MSEPRFDPLQILAVLDRHNVEYVLVGGYAANQHGARRPTKDIDVTPATTLENLTRLAAALKELRAGIRVDAMPDGLPFDASAEALRGVKMLNLRTQFGDCDLTFTPSGFPTGYDELARGATARVVDGVTVRVAALTDIIKSKAAANRLKDQEALPELERLAARARRAVELPPPPGIDL